MKSEWCASIFPCWSVVLDIMQGLVIRVGLPALGNDLDVLCLAECCLCDRPTLMKVSLVLTNELAEA